MLEFRHEMVDVIAGFETVIVTIGEGGKREMRESGGLAHAAVSGERSEEGDVDVAMGSEALGELEGRVDVALSAICYQ